MADSAFDAVTAHPRPYRGLPPFRTEDRHLFFGRGPELAAVEAMVRAEPFSLLHACSGAGKSSLINAGLVPRLEELGLLCVVARPFDDPVAVLKGETLARVLPPPHLEAAALRRAVAALGPSASGEPMSLKGLRSAVDSALSITDPRYLEVRGPLRIAPGPDAPSGEIMPFAVRFLVGTGRPVLFARQIEALARFAGLSPTAALRIDPPAGMPFVDALADVHLPQIVEFFEDARIAEAHGNIRQNLGCADVGLLSFFDRLVGLWGSGFEEFSLVLILDQFEELFTRFGRGERTADAYEGAARPRTGRESYFHALQAILPRPVGRPSLPLRVMLSMREDHVAALDELETLTGPVPLAARYRLHLLGREACEMAISRPAQMFGIRYAPDVLTRLVDELVSDEGEVLPSHLQVVCNRLDAEFGPDGDLEVGAQLPESLGWVEGILGRFFSDFLDHCAEGESSTELLLDRLEMLDLLEPMITLGGRRNIVERNLLICAPFRRPSRRRALLERMSAQRLVRTEYRHNLAFVEITHEFLIPSVREALRTAEGGRPALGSLRSAFNRLARIEAGGPRSPLTEMPDEREYDALWDYRGRLYIEPEPGATAHEAALAQPWVAEVMLRTAVRRGCSSEHVRFWAARVDEVRAHEEAAPVDALRTLSRSGGLLGALELESIVTTATAQDLDERELATLVRSALADGEPAMVRRIIQWVLEVQHAAA